MKFDVLKQANNISPPPPPINISQKNKKICPVCASLLQKIAEGYLMCNICDFYIYVQKTRGEKYMSYKLSLIVPCYNEKRTIETCIEKVLDISHEQDFSLELVIVDDASRDGSWQILEKTAARYS
jgi:cellulose synthase/poly-beta-1,6-N-acetylglucosamine synthase-like glycosyltransferase